MATFYAARSEIITPLPWPTFALPFSRVGYQQARQNTSLLILKIGNKVMVDGCHSYRTHVFDATDPMAPKLFEEGYDCQEIMYASDERRPVAAKSHSSIDSWSRWVRDMINADVARSQRTQPYRKVFRPRPPKPRYAAPYRSSGFGHPDPRPSVGLGRETPSFGGATPSLDDWRRAAIPTQSTAAPITAPNSPPAERADSSAVVSEPSATKSLRATRFSSLTDRMIAYGPAAAAAVLAHLDAPSDSRTRTLLSPKSREALTWVSEERGEPPSRLMNPVEYLLINLKRTGVDLDSLFASSADTKTASGQLTQSATGPKKAPVSEVHKFPPLPDDPNGRLELLLEHVDALEDLRMWKRTFEQRKAFVIAVRKLKERSPDLRPTEIAELQSLYQELRQGGKDKPK